MSGSTPADRTARLEHLLDAFSYPERRSPRLLQEIETLIEEARHEGLLTLGASPAEVRAAIGPPHRVVGEEHEARFDWHYPGLPPVGTPDRSGEWNLVLRFRQGALRTIERRTWRELR